jgi:two-component system, chemotaxis family, CheB/CheR fusion protein
LADPKQRRAETPPKSRKIQTKKKSAVRRQVGASRNGPAAPSSAVAGQDGTSPAAGPERNAPKSGPLFPIVAIGASAGGLDPIMLLLTQVPADTGMAFVVIQHLDPQHASQLPELLARVTPMTVAAVTDGQRINPNRVYVIPPNAHMTVVSGKLRLIARDADRQSFRPIDEFFKTLAQDRLQKAIGVVLSGTGTDGTLGLKYIKAEGGITFAQDEESSKFNGMPHSAISAGVADIVLPPDQIGQRLATLGDQAYVRKEPIPPAAPAAAPPDDVAALHQITALLRTKTGVDFFAYKQTTLGRRIQRRIMLSGSESLPAYAAYLEAHPAELSSLYDDIFIHVTSFFRDGDIYETLKRKVFPKLVGDRPGGEPIRIWVPGCSTGEEVYSLAITWLEFAETLAEPVSLKIFGTDISAAAVDTARAGRYAQDITATVSPERLNHHFVRVPSGYQVSKLVRDMCVFAPHNLLTDPPFANLDLICCRNVLIYLETDFQQGLLQVFHHALNASGYLVLGPSEDIGPLGDLFAVQDKKHCIYTKKAGSRQAFNALPSGRQTWGRAPGKPTPDGPRETEADAPQAVWAAADRVALAEYAPASVVVDADLNILQVRGHLGMFVELPLGPPSRNLAKMAREGLSLALTSLVRKARQSNVTARRAGLRVKFDGQTRRVSVEVIPFQVSPQSKECFFLVSFSESPNTKGAVPRAQAQAGEATTDGVSAQSVPERELQEARETLLAVTAERDANYEELTAALEELQSGNEELQSTNEELQTAKEELQSANEELTTLNEELENQNRELGLALGNLSNIVDSVRIPIVIVGGNLRIRLYNPAAEQVLSIVGTDIGRLISEVKTRLNVTELEPLIRSAIQTLTPYDQEVQDREGRWYAMRVRPYQSMENTIDGAVLTWTDISTLKASLTTMTAGRDYLAAIMGTVRSPLLVLNSDLRVKSVNQAYLDTFQTARAETENHSFYALGNGQWDDPELRRLLEQVLPESTQFHGMEVERYFPAIGRRSMLLNARRIEPEQAQGSLILLAIDDITSIKQVTEMDQLRQWSGRLEAAREEERMNLSRDVHDDLGGALTALKMQLHRVRAGLTAEQAPLHAITLAMSDLIDQQIRHVRRIATSLRPAVLDDFGLLPAMEWQIGEFKTQTGIACVLEAKVDEVSLSHDALTAVFRIFQEALTNVARHSQATRVEVSLDDRDGHLHLQLRDNGQGIAAAAIVGKGSLGLMGMRERAFQAGGELDIDSAPDRGTIVRLRLPLLRAPTST